VQVREPGMVYSDLLITVIPGLRKIIVLHQMFVILKFWENESTPIQVLVYTPLPIMARHGMLIQMA